MHTVSTQTICEFLGPDSSLKRSETLDVCSRKFPDRKTQDDWKIVAGGSCGQNMKMYLCCRKLRFEIAQVLEMLPPEQNMSSRCLLKCSCLIRDNSAIYIHGQRLQICGSVPSIKETKQDQDFSLGEQDGVEESEPSELEWNSEWNLSPEPDRRPNWNEGVPEFDQTMVASLDVQDGVEESEPSELERNSEWKLSPEPERRPNWNEGVPEFDQTMVASLDVWETDDTMKQHLKFTPLDRLALPTLSPPLPSLAPLCPVTEIRTGIASGLHMRERDVSVFGCLRSKEIFICYFTTLQASARPEYFWVRLNIFRISGPSTFESLSWCMGWCGCHVVW